MRSVLSAGASVVFFIVGCAGPSRYVIIRIPPPAPGAPTGSWPPRDDAGVAPDSWCATACAGFARPGEQTRGCRLVNVAKYPLGVAEGVACEFE